MKNTSIRFRIFFSYSFLLIFAILITLLVRQKIGRDYYKEVVLSSYGRELVYIMNQLETQLDFVEDYQKSISLDPVVMDTLSRNQKAPKEESRYYSMNRTLRNRVTAILGANKYIYQYIFITLDNDFLSFRDEAFPSLVEEILGSDYFEKNNRDKRGLVLKGPYELEQINHDRLQFFVLSKQVVDLNTFKPLGYIAFIIREDFFSDIFENNLSKEHRIDYYMISDDNIVLSAANKDAIGEKFMDQQGLSDDIFTKLLENGNCEVKINGKTVLYSLLEMSNNRKIVYLTSMDELLKEQRKVMWLSTIVGSIACMLALYLAFSIADHITAPIGALSKKMINYYQMKESVEENVQFSGNEIDNLYFAFEQLLKNADLMLRQIYIEQQEKSSYQFQLVQAQIKPHFLYNTLEMIKSLVDCQMYEEAGEAIMAVSQFYRLTLNLGKNITTIAQELELTRMYMYIQSLRYAEYIEYSIEEKEGMEKYCIPKLTLQPLLENSIYHGIKAKQEMGRIEVKILENEDTINIEVWDNGVGIARDQLVNMQTALKEAEKKKENSFGLYSINRRIKLFYGNEFGVSIDSELNRFTRVVLTIPKIDITEYKEDIRGV